MFIFHYDTLKGFVELLKQKRVNGPLDRAGRMRSASLQVVEKKEGDGPACGLVKVRSASSK